MTDGKNKKKYLTQKELDKYRALLWEKRNELLGNVSYLEKDIKKDESGELSHIPIHMADLGTDSYEQDFAIDLMDSERKIIIEIDKAFQRIDSGEYGICEIGGELIPKARLDAIPWAKYCVKCASNAEKNSSRTNNSYGKYNFNTMEEEDDSDDDDVKKVS